MRLRRSHRRPDHRREGAPFFKPQVLQSGAPASGGFFGRVAQQQEPVPTAAVSERRETGAAQNIDDRDLARQGDKREEETTARQGDKREEETTARQADKREEETTVRQGDKREEEEAKPAPAQAPVSAQRIPRQSTSGPGARQPAEAPRQDLSAPRFAGDQRLEAALDNRRTVRRGDRGDHVMRLQQALVELGFQLPGVGVDGRFGPETEQAVRDYQAAHGLAVDGIVGPQTMGDLDRRLHLPMPNWTGSLRDRMRQLIARGEGYARLRAEVQTASILDRIFALLDRAFLREIAGLLVWDDFARIAELLGRGAPDGNALIADAAVQAALADAWTDSNPAVTSWDADDPAHPSHADCSLSVSPHPRAAITGTHEEGGWIYLNLITGGVYTRRAPRGAQAAIPLANPPQILDSIVVGAFHTHPNLGACWGVQPGAGDIAFSRFVGVPLLARGMVGAATRDFVTPAPAPQRRAHLAGPRDYPHAGGALAPQADRYATRAGSEALS